MAILIKNLGELFTKADYMALARRLDRDFNERLTKNEFCDALLPNDVSREDVEIRVKKDILNKPGDYFYNPINTIKKEQENMMDKTEKRQYLKQNINLVNQDYDNDFAGEDELKHIRPFLRNQQDIMVFQNENFFRQAKSVKPQNKDKNDEIVMAPLERPIQRPSVNNQRTGLGHLRESQNPRPLVNSVLLRTKKHIFDEKEFYNSPERHDAELLKLSVHAIEVDTGKRSNIHNSRNSGYVSQNDSKFAHLFERKI